MFKVILKLLLVLIFSFGIFYLFWPKLANSKYEPVCSQKCGNEKVCMNTAFYNLLFEKCNLIPKKAPIQNLKLPFSKETPVFCTHSSGAGTHAWPNAYWALDLATTYEKKNAMIYASGDGIAYVSPEQCNSPNGTPANAQTSFCGQGFGNWIKIYHGDGYYSFYAHLNEIFVKNGMQVKAGMPIGVEGWTGMAGHRHLHWSIQKIAINAKEDLEQQILTLIGESVPFDFYATVNNEIQKFHADNLKCDHKNISTEMKPTFLGIF